MTMPPTPKMKPKKAIDRMRRRRLYKTKTTIIREKIMPIVIKPTRKKGRDIMGVKRRNGYW